MTCLLSLDHQLLIGGFGQKNYKGILLRNSRILSLVTPLGAWTIEEKEEFYDYWEWWKKEDNSVYQYQDKVWYRIPR